MKWIKVTDRLPEMYQRVLTALFDGSLEVNFVVHEHVQQADETLVEVYQWNNNNLHVAYWLDGLPKLPEQPAVPEESEVR